MILHTKFIFKRITSISDVGFSLVHEYEPWTSYAPRLEMRIIGFVLKHKTVVFTHWLIWCPWLISRLPVDSMWVRMLPRIGRSYPPRGKIKGDHPRTDWQKNTSPDPHTHCASTMHRTSNVRSLPSCSAMTSTEIYYNLPSIRPRKREWAWGHYSGVLLHEVFRMYQ